MGDRPVVGSFRINIVTSENNDKLISNITISSDPNFRSQLFFLNIISSNPVEILDDDNKKMELITEDNVKKYFLDKRYEKYKKTEFNNLMFPYSYLVKCGYSYEYIFFEKTIKIVHDKTEVFFVAVIARDFYFGDIVFPWNLECLNYVLHEKYVGVGDKYVINNVLSLMKKLK